MNADETTATSTTVEAVEDETTATDVNETGTTTEEETMIEIETEDVQIEEMTVITAVVRGEPAQVDVRRTELEKSHLVSRETTEEETTARRIEMEVIGEERGMPTHDVIAGETMTMIYETEEEDLAEVHLLLGAEETTSSAITAGETTKEKVCSYSPHLL